MAGALVGLLIGIIIWTAAMSHLPAKAGYKGWKRFMWFLFLACPLTTGITLFIFVLMRWPVQKDLEVTEIKLSERMGLVDPQETYELRKLRLYKELEELKRMKNN